MSDLATTVVIPVWDEYVAERLPEALQSLRQEPPPQIIVVDNASTVEVPEVSGAHVVRTPRRMALGSARNLGLERVNTRYVVFWDADDAMLPGTLAFLEREIASATGVVAVAAAIIEDPSGNRHRHPRRWAPLLMRAPSLFALLHSIWSLYPTTGATIIDAEAARAAGGFADADSGEDWVLGVSLAFRGSIAFSERPGRLYRVHKHSVWARHMTLRHEIGHARAVRERLKTDHGIPRWARAMRPLIAVGQWLAIAAHEGLEVLRRGRPRA